MSAGRKARDLRIASLEGSLLYEKCGVVGQGDELWQLGTVYWTV